mmetsp:Transcript_5077/g.9449  ORF Transcript_5077/g.9449 Transcript_5077/m.9449 type:complete len:211 (-) Transcript_5077:889-1521(-)
MSVCVFVTNSDHFSTVGKHFSRRWESASPRDREIDRQAAHISHRSIEIGSVVHVPANVFGVAPFEMRGMHMKVLPHGVHSINVGVMDPKEGIVGTGHVFHLSSHNEMRRGMRADLQVESVSTDALSVWIDGFDIVATGDEIPSRKFIVIDNLRNDLRFTPKVPIVVVFSIQTSVPSSIFVHDIPRTTASVSFGKDSKRLVFIKDGELSVS